MNEVRTPAMTERKDKVCWLKQGVNIKLLALKLEEKEEREDLETKGEGVGRNLEREPRSVEEERGEIKRLEGRRREQEREREGGGIKWTEKKKQVKYSGL